ncbi:putative DNA-binding transcriptional regulator YafY [Pseudonocardia kunmingensis]|uniref:Putative DNA-binding transcriptional regulator YafY n=2 Tax=Pseudonocardia kunmingensis TaxID=630975 RepID=A0A543E328_9PSEU|nr:putative DNA-binding transcriptional regulator YafY [Pseudonocardia kunmingensis]
MLALLSTLQNGRTWSGQDLAARLRTSPRTLRRDVDRLRELGYPVQARPGPGGHYRLVAGTAMPPLLLDDDEAVAIAVGLRLAASTRARADDEPDDDAAARALRKLEQVLPARLRHTVRTVHRATEAAPAPGAVVSTRLLSLVGSAAEQHERLVFGYRSRSGEPTERRVEPYRQVLAGRRWYLLGWDLDRADWRTFRLDRVAAARTTGERFTPRPLPAESAAAYLDAVLKAPRHRAVLTFLAPVERMADRIGHQDGTLEPLGPDRCRYTTWVDSFEWLAVVTATLGVEFRVEEPVGFAEYCAQLRDRLDRATTGAPSLAGVTREERRRTPSAPGPAPSPATPPR